MNEDIMEAIFKQEQQIKNEAIAHNMQQLAFGSSSAGSILSATATSNVSTVATTAATNLYSTSTYGVSQQRYYKKAVVANASLFMDDNLKISEASPYATLSNNMHKLDDMSHISSRYAITEYFNVMYYDSLLTPGSKCRYAINDTKNIIKHNNIFRQSFENIVQHKGLFTIKKIVDKWEKLHKALI